MAALLPPPQVWPGWFPLTERAKYDVVLFWWSLFPLFASMQWLTSWYGMGKTSVPRSALNMPGRLAWATMETPGCAVLVYTMWWASERRGIEDLPWENKVLAGLFAIHYTYRALLYPLMAPGISPIHAAIWASGLAFQVVNGSCLGAWLGAFGPTSRDEWRATGPLATARFVLGIAVFYLGLAGNFIHDEELREIRRLEARRLRHRPSSAPSAAAVAASVDKVYRLPTAALFRYMLYPHYLLELVEWLGFYVAAGPRCFPALVFVVNLVAALVPRAVRGRRWYVERFGQEKVRGRWVILPGLV